MKALIRDWIKDFYMHNGQFDQAAYDSQILYWTLGLVVAFGLLSLLIWFISRGILLQIVHAWAVRTKATWDDHLVNNKVFKGFALLVPLGFLEYFLSIAFFNYPEVLAYSDMFVAIIMILIIMVIVNRSLNGLRDILLEIDSLRDKPIASYTQIMKIVISGILIIVILSILTNRSPLFFLGSLGAISAVLLLVFRDTILGFVGSIQLATNDMIRIGDWITMEKFGADGDVQEINLTTVKVRNFDNTITTIPTYSFISDSFRNWRGMQESDGRRVKRSIKIQIDTIKFASPELLKKLSKVEILKTFVEERQHEIEEYNEKHGFVGERAINARQQTNLGLFRRYIEHYLKHNNMINDEMTLMVRQLEPTENGLPLEVYCFTKTKEWLPYENIIADVFDHIFAIINQFELKAFESPSGSDFQKLGK